MNNVRLLESQLRTKLSATFMTGLITEAFIRALPFDTNEVNKEISALSAFSTAVVSKMHPENLLKNACEANQGNINALRFLNNLNDSVNLVTNKAVKLALEAADNTSSVPEIIDAADFSKVDNSDIVNASKSAGINEVASLIKDKVIDVLKAEKAAYDENEKLIDEIKEVISADTDDTGAVESYLNVILNPLDPRMPVSLFSKIQDICIEALLYSSEDIKNVELPVETMKTITLESTFNCFDLSNRSLKEEIIAMESIEKSISSDDIEDRKKCVVDKSLVCAICIYTLFETLHTMNLYTPTSNEIRDIVDTKTTIKNIAVSNLDRVKNMIDATLDTVKNILAKSGFTNETALSSIDNLTSIKEMLSSIKVNDAEKNKLNTLVNSIDSVIIEIQKFIAANNIESKELPTYKLREKEFNIAEVDRAIKLTFAKPDVKLVSFRVDNLLNNAKDHDGNDFYINVYGISGDNKIISQIIIGLKYRYEFGATPIDCLKLAIENRTQFNVPVNLYYIDSGKTINM